MDLYFKYYIFFLLYYLTGFPQPIYLFILLNFLPVLLHDTNTGTLN